MNVRIGELQSIPAEGLEGRFKFNITRTTKDKIVNSKGKTFVEACDSQNLVILNGRTPGDSRGEYTFLGGPGCSVNDICAVSFNIINHVKDFIVRSEIFSDHMPIQLTLNLDVRNKKENLLPLLPKLIWTPLDNLHFKPKLENLLNSINLETNNTQELINSFISLINNSANLGNQKLKNSMLNKNKTNKRWFDKDCKLLRNRSFALLNLFRKTNMNMIKNTYILVNKEYKQTCFNKKKEYYLQINAQFKEVYDSKNFWQLVRKVTPSNFIGGMEIEAGEWLKYFNDLLNPPLNVDHMNYVAPLISDPQLDEPFQINELSYVIKKAKCGKAPGPDRVPYEFFKNSPPIFLDKLLDVFNYIYESGNVPASFGSSIIFPLFKKGDRNVVSNYRGVAFSDSIAKLFTGLLLKRLNEWVNNNNILCEYQAGFRVGYSTVDNIFNLMNIIKIKTSVKGGKLYCFFVDLKAAFDSLDRNALYYKLYALGVSSKFIAALQGLYQNTKSCVWTSQGVTDSFEGRMGLKQGCLLSPLLFSLFIDDISECIEGGIRVAGTKIRCLMYADDIVVMADHPLILQEMIDKFSDYCKMWNLTINLNKSQIVVFRNGGRLARSERWRLNGETISVVNEYKYLGVILTSKLSLNKHFDERLSASKFSIYSTYSNFFKNNKIPISSKFVVFSAVCRAILCYAAQIWGFVRCDKVEQLFIYFVRRLFSLPQNTPHYVIYLETDTYPLFLFTLKLHIAYIQKILLLPCHRLTKILAEEVIRRKVFWFGEFGSLCRRYDWENSNYIIDGDKQCFDGLMENIKSEFKNNLSVKVNNSSYHQLYKELNYDLGANGYISDSCGLHLAKSLIKIRGQLLYLNCNVSRAVEVHYCTMCNKGDIEDMYHYIGVCPILKEHRIRWLGKAVLCKNEYISYMNGKDWHALYNYHVAAWKYRYFLISEFNN